MLSSPLKESEDLRTFHEWSKRGYMIEKGSKSIGININGVPLFSRDQVCYIASNNSYSGDDPADEEYDPDLPGNPEDYGCKD